MALDPVLCSILACPEDHGPLYVVESHDVLFNPRTRRTYPIRDGIPVMLIEESAVLDEAAAAELVGVVERDGLQPTFSE
ncbi:MAG: hypothetical protein RLZZ01_852 [Actinomycetota bacterium]|jgi:uncharacterized protein YbaR (Trm112 family)